MSSNPNTKTYPLWSSDRTNIDGIVASPGIHQQRLNTECQSEIDVSQYCSYLSTNPGLSSPRSHKVRSEQKVEKVREEQAVSQCVYNQLQNQLITKDRSNMNIDFFLSDEQLDKLVSAFIELQVKQSGSNVHERAKKEVVLLNSILIALSQQKQAISALFTEIKYNLEVNQNDRKNMQRAAHLMLEVNKRSPNLLVKTPTEVITQIVDLACQKAFIAVCGNAYIALLQQIISTLSTNQQTTKHIFIKLIQFLISPKLLVATYRQQTRQCLYKLYLKSLQFYTTLKSDSTQQPHSINQQHFLQRCISSGSGQKDPRNIGLVFELYLQIFQLFPVSQLTKHRTSIFQNLQSYYPIQFVGDQDNEQHKKINVQQISYLLDQCLTHPLFKEQTWELFTVKTAAPPIAPFVSTFLLYLSRRRTDSPFGELTSRLNNLLTRLSEEQFIEEDYPENQPDLGNILVSILDYIFCSNDHSYSIQSYQIVMNWMQMMIKRVVSGECKHSGTMMGIFRSIVKNNKHKRSTTLIQLFRSLALRSVFNILSLQNQIVPKLGLAIVALGQLDYVSVNLKQIIGLLILQVGKLYPSATDQIKMLLLKILLQIYRGSPENRIMVRKTNDSFILKDCLARAKQAFTVQLEPTQAYLVKAFIDFVTTVYLNETQAIISNVQGNNYQLQTYLIGRLLENLHNDKLHTQNKIQKLQLLRNRFNILISNIKQEQHSEAIMKALKVITPQICLILVKEANWLANTHSPKLIFNLILQIRDHLRQKRSDQPEKQLQKSQQSTIQQISGIFDNNQVRGSSGNTLLQQLWERISLQQNCTISLPGLWQLKELSGKFILDNQFVLGYQPTFIHWQWQNLKQITDQSAKQERMNTLLNYLPQKLLLRDSQHVLKTAIKNQKQTSSLLKIVRHLDISAIKQTGIIQYCIEYLDSLYKNSTKLQSSTERSVCVMAIFIDLLEKDKSDELKQILKQHKKALKSLLLHRKRPVRQAVRKILLLLQE